LIFDALKSKDKAAKVGTVYNLQTTYANSSSPEDLKAAEYADAYSNGWFLEPLYLGHYPQSLQELFEGSMPETSKADMEIIKIGSRLHALGINYYRGETVEWDAASDIKSRPVELEGGPTNDLGWPIYVPPYYPEAFTDILQQTYYRYRDQGLNRIYITENGMALNSPWDGKSEVVNDSRRIEYLKAHIKQVHDAILQGVPIKAYFLCTLMDNFEWCHGYKPDSCFGITYVDRKTMKRVRKQSSMWYEQLIRTRTLND